MRHKQDGYLFNTGNLMNGVFMARKRCRTTRIITYYESFILHKYMYIEPDETIHYGDTTERAPDDEYNTNSVVQVDWQ